MAHGREGPDIVMNIRYAGVSKIRAVSGHEKDRTPDGSSAIDPTRSHLNEILVGPATQQEALEKLWASGVRPPTQQAEEPYVQMVLSASPQFFRTPGQGPGEFDKKKVAEWQQATKKWLEDEYGPDLVHLSLHLDEDTPHLHALIVPTYEKRPRMPGRPKRGETREAFEARRQEVENAVGVRTAGRSSCPQWSRKFARLHARKSYHAAMESMGLGYGRDFIAEGEPSPEHRTTGQWVRQQAAEVVKAKAEAEATAAVVISEAETRAEAVIENAETDAAKAAEEAERKAAAAVQDAEAKAAEAEARRGEAEAGALRVSAKAAALLTATAALTAEMTEGTLRRTSDGKISVKNRGAIQGGLPDLAPALRAATDAAEARRQEEAAAEAAKAERTRAEAEAEAVRAEAARVLQQAEADRAAAAADRKETETIKAEILTLRDRMRGVMTLLRSGLARVGVHLSKDQRAEAADAIRQAERLITPPASTAKPEKPADDTGFRM